MRTRKARKAKAKKENEAVEGMRAWSKAEARTKGEIARIASEASERIRAREEAKIVKRERGRRTR